MMSTYEGFAPGVSHRESGGLSPRQVIDAIHCIPGTTMDCHLERNAVTYHVVLSLGRVVGADLVELNPDRDVDGITAVLAAKIMKELVSKIAISRRSSDTQQTTYKIKIC